MQGSLEVIKKHYFELYPNCDQAFEALWQETIKAKAGRDPLLLASDATDTQWIGNHDTVGTMLYVDLFSSNLRGLKTHLAYLEKLGVNLVHLMPLLAPRRGENDGGYAVRDYRNIDDRLGQLEDFKEILAAGRTLGIRYCIDYVVNHTAEDHAWARAAKAGDGHYQSFYHIVQDTREVALWEGALPQVFPKVAPGNFTYVPELNAHVMTTFYPYQWDLNFSNPLVFNAMMENLYFFANLGIDMIRLDAIPYVWKVIGTNSRNLPQVHSILRLFRELLALVAPSVALLGEVIMAPRLIAPYFGTDQAPECHVLYHASNMVALWNSLATRDARHLEHAYREGLDVKGIWMNYARCHDDIGWGLDEGHLRSLGFSPDLHKQFLIDFYFGILPDSFSTGALYEFDERTGDARNSGTLASLAGLERALSASDAYQVDLAIKRILLLHALVILRPGIPMLYAGDEIAQLNQWAYRADPLKAHDSRWLHRVPMDWALVEELDQVEAYDQLELGGQAPFKWTRRRAAKAVYEGVKALIDYRRHGFGVEALREEAAIYHGNTAVFVLAIDLNHLLMVNLSELPQVVETAPIKRHGIRGGWQDGLSGKSVDFEGSKLLMGPLEINILRNVKKST